MRVVWTNTALRGLEEIRAYISADSRVAAAKVIERIRAATTWLGCHPESSRRTQVFGVRALVVPGTNYILPYRVSGDTVEILVVLHGAQLMPEEL